MLTAPFFSIIIPAYNCAHLIGETIDSARAQQFSDYEIIVVNDGSTDTTADVISRCSTSLSGRITIINQENKGEGGARNRGIFCARGKYLAFLDQDDLWFPWTLKTYYQVLAKHDFPAILVGSGKDFTVELSHEIFQEKPSIEKYYEDFFSLARHPYLPTGTPGTVVRADEARRVHGLSEARVVGIDQEFYYKLGDAKGLVFVSAPLTVAIRRHAGNLQKNTAMAAQGALFIIDKEKAGQYPGGSERMWSRRFLMTRVVRTISLQCLRSKYFAQGMKIYQQTFFWHICLCRIKYLVGFPLAYLLERSRNHGKSE
jgi:glycosyltransferase involved in cell wall biosynthesis